MNLSQVLSRLGKAVPPQARRKIAPLIPFSRTARLYKLLAPPLVPLEQMLQRPGFGWEMSERAVEIPWAIGKYRGERTVLEIGHAHAEPPYVELLKQLRIPELHGLDLVRGPYAAFIQKIGDIRRAPYPDAFFDLTFCISTVEHVGQDNAEYGTPGAEKNDGDFTAMKEMFRITKPGGRVLVTVPFGAPRDYGWQIQYDAQRLDRLLAAAPFEIVTVDYFGYDKGWYRKAREALSGAEYQKGAPNAAALACAELRRPV